MTTPRTTSRPRRRAAFSLIELLVVIGIIVLLIGLVVGTMSALARGSEERQTRLLMQQLTTIVEQWQSTSERLPTWSDNAAADVEMIDDVEPGPFSTTQLFNVVARAEAVFSMLGRVEPQLVHTLRVGEHPIWLTLAYDGAESDADQRWAVDNTSGRFSRGVVILDPWENPILAIHPGVLHDYWSQGLEIGGQQLDGPFDDPADEPDDDGTVRTESENRFGVAVNRRIYFVSAGPDGRFGDLQLGETSPDAVDPDLVNEARDNVHSYDVLTDGAHAVQQTQQQ